MNDNNTNKNTVDFNENDSDSMRKTICSTPTRCVKMNELNEGEIQEKIDALNLHYDQIAEESGIENNINKNKHQNNFFSSDIKKFIESESSNQAFIENDDESLNINEILLKSINKGTNGPNMNLIQNPDAKGNRNTNDLCLKSSEANKVNIDIEDKNQYGNLNKDAINSQVTFEEKKPSQSNVTHHQGNRISDLEVINQDHYLKPFEGRIKERIEMMNKLIKDIEKNENSLIEFSQGFKKMGFNVTSKGITFREYAPGAKSISLVCNNKKLSIL